MSTFLISYELNDKHREPALLAALEVFEDRIQAMSSLWFIHTPWSADQIWAHLARHLAPEDSLVIEAMPVGQGWSGWIGEDVRAWLEKHLGPSS